MKFTLHFVTSFLSIVILVSVSGKVSSYHKKEVSSLKIYCNKTQETQNMLEIFLQDSPRSNTEKQNHTRATRLCSVTATVTSIRTAPNITLKLLALEKSWATVS
jgi:hypothetical protein